jgi:hypothetical protein
MPQRGSAKGQFETRVAWSVDARGSSSAEAIESYTTRDNAKAAMMRQCRVIMDEFS